MTKFRPDNEAQRLGTVVPLESIVRAIFQIRGHRVMLDEDLAALYEVEVKVLNQAVKRNLACFPEDFMFQLTREEAAILRSQTVTLKAGRGDRLGLRLGKTSGNDLVDERYTDTNR